MATGMKARFTVLDTPFLYCASDSSATMTRVSFLAAAAVTASATCSGLALIGGAPCRQWGSGAVGGGSEEVGGQWGCFLKAVGQEGYGSLACVPHGCCVCGQEWPWDISASFRRSLKHQA